jgi:hypothetical protein
LRNTNDREFSNHAVVEGVMERVVVVVVMAAVAQH